MNTSQSTYPPFQTGVHRRTDSPGRETNLKSDYGRCPSWQSSLSLWHKLLSPFLEVSTARAACCPALCPLLANNVIHLLVAGLDDIHPHYRPCLSVFFFFFFSCFVWSARIVSSVLPCGLTNVPLFQLLFAEILSICAGTALHLTLHNEPLLKVKFTQIELTPVQ